jgi:hypothetical protein
MMNTQTMPDAARLRITLADLDPASWRVVDVPLSMTFKGLHDTIQAAFQWFDCHLWEFDVDGKRYAVPFDDGFGEDKVYNANTTRLVKLRDKAITRFLYTYDMGDNWQHHIEVLELLDQPVGSRLPKFLDGQWRTPPEDVGGTSGFQYFLEAMNDPNHEEHEEVMDWHGEPFEPNNIDEDILKIHMKRLANMRRPKK